MTEFSLRDKGVIVGKLGRSRKITIPRDVCEKIGLHEGEFIGLKITRAGVLLLPQTTLLKLVRKGLARRSASQST